MKSQWIIRRFMKKKAVKIYLIKEDKRSELWWCIPETNGDVIIKDLAFKLNKEDMLLSRNIPTYFVNIEDAESINMYGNKENPYSPAEYKIGITTKVLKDAFDASKKSVISQETIIILGAVLIGFLGLGFFLNEKLDTIYEALKALGIV